MKIVQLLTVDEGEPPAPGLYVVYVNDEFAARRFAGRELLLWDEGAWWRRWSTVRYRGHVYGWIGPLPTMELEDAKEPAS